MGSKRDRDGLTAARLPRRPLSPIVTGLLLVFLMLGPITSADASFGFKSLSSTFTVPGGEAPAALPAGSHPESWSTSLDFNTLGEPGEEQPDGALKDLTIALPTGLVGATGLMPTCAHAEFLAESCPGSTALGSLSLDVGEPLPLATVYLLEPPSGSAAQLGFHAQLIPVTIDLSISPQPPHNLIARNTNASQVGELFGSILTLEGIPGGNPFLTLPRSCAAPLATAFAAVSWQSPDTWATAVAPDSQTTTDCASLVYSPTLTVAPTTTSAAAPSGLDVDFDAPDPGISSSTGRAAADTAAAILELPPGLTLNPPVAAGLAACGPAALATERADADPATGCPETARLGSATVTTPLFDKPIAGALYAAAPHENPFGSLLALYLVLRDPERGVLLSLPIRIDADSASGRLTARFEQVPELPLSHLSLRFNFGPRAPLGTPPGCGARTIAYSLFPSSGNPPLTGTDSFSTSSNCDTGFAPRLAAGTASNSAGRAAALVLELANSASAQNLAGLELTLPPGLAADFSAASICPEGAAVTAACPPASRLGYARIALGTGPDPLWVPGAPDPDSDVYLAGSYRGAPYSLVVSIPAAAGPFDLGRVVLRAPVRIDPDTAQASVRLDALPQIIDGIPLHYRAIRLVFDRPGFVRNPTSCEPMRIELEASSENGAAATASDRFQASDCAALRLRPRLALRLSGGLGRNAHPRVEVHLASGPGQANLSAARIDLPAGELLDTHRIRALCAREVPAGRCPDPSRLGWATIRSPLLPDPLRGPIFLRVPSGRYPDLLAEVRGGGIRLRLHGRTASAPSGRLRFRLAGLPDLPLSKAAITLAGGRRGIVVNSETLCGRPRRAVAQLDGHNGKHLLLRPLLRVNGRC